MTFGERLVLSRKKEGLTQKKLSEILEITPTRLNYWEKNKREPDVEMLKKIAKALNTSCDFLIGTEAYIDTVNNKETLILKNFNRLNELGQEEAIKRIEELAQIPKYSLIEDFNNKNVDFSSMNNNKQTKDELSITNTNIIELKLFNTPASAGTGNYIDNDDYELITVDLNRYPQLAQVDFAVRVQGDSMEPLYYNNDIVFVKEQPTVENGQIGIFIYDGESYIKKLEIFDNDAYLVSINTKYKPIKINEHSDIKTCGLVINK